MCKNKFFFVAFEHFLFKLIIIIFSKLIVSEIRISLKINNEVSILEFNGIISIF